MDNSLHSENTQNYAIAESKLSDDQVASLYEFIEDKLPGGGSSAESQILKLRYRPDEWDRLGAIQEAQDIAKKCISEEHELASYLEPREFLIVRTEGLQTYSCEYKADESSKETLYTAIVTANSPESYDLGETVYTVSGEGFKPCYWI
jgi:hypothetical protein